MPAHLRKLNKRPPNYHEKILKWVEIDCALKRLSHIESAVLIHAHLLQLEGKIVSWDAIRKLYLKRLQTPLNNRLSGLAVTKLMNMGLLIRVKYATRTTHQYVAIIGTDINEPINYIEQRGYFI